MTVVILDPLRITCQVLSGIATHGPCDSMQLSTKLELESHQIVRAIYRLLNQDRVKKVGTKRRSSSDGRPLYIYEINENWLPKEQRKSKRIRKGRASTKEARRAGGVPRFENVVIANRDRKIRVLRKVVGSLGESDTDIVIGILADYGAVL